MKTINRQKVLDNLYSATYNGETIHVWARSEAAAHQKTVEHFRLKKKDGEYIKITEMVKA